MATAAQPAPDFRSLIDTPIAWTATEDVDVPWQAVLGAHALTVRLNSFPDEALYSLIANGHLVAEFDDWPTAWTRPIVS